jgi:hypothetical protein
MTPPWFRDQIVSTRLAEVRRLLERGAKRGQLRAGLDPELAHDLLFGPVYYRLLLSGRALDEALAERIVTPCYRRCAEHEHTARPITRPRAGRSDAAPPRRMRGQAFRDPGDRPHSRRRLTREGLSDELRRRSGVVLFDRSATLVASAVADCPGGLAPFSGDRQRRKLELVGVDA